MGITQIFTLMFIKSLGVFSLASLNDARGSDDIIDTYSNKWQPHC